MEVRGTTCTNNACPYPSHRRIRVRPLQLFLLFGCVAGAMLSTASPAFAQTGTETGTETALSQARLWVLICSALVFLMQAGFSCFEVGVVQKKNATGVAIKNLVDWVIVSPAFFFVGFGLMFGTSLWGFIGTDLFALSGIEDSAGNGLGWTFFLFQMAFAGTAATIVSGAMSERTKFLPYVLVALMAGILVYPVVGHWIWGNLFYSGNTPWLAQLGFHDFAGSTVVHTTGATIAFVGVAMVGPRIGRYDETGNLRHLTSNNYSFAVLGVFVLWFGWWGFNGGNALAFNDNVGKIILNTNLAGAAAGLSAYVHARFFNDREAATDKFIGGILGGLVAITAGADILSPLTSYLLGLIAGVVHNLAFDLMNRLRLDDPVGAIPVHGFCGVLGTIWVALAGPADALEHARPLQLGVQILGASAVILWSGTCTFAYFSVLKRTTGLRVSPQEEREGLNILGSTAKFATKAQTLSTAEIISILQYQETEEKETLKEAQSEVAASLPPSPPSPSGSEEPE